MIESFMRIHKCVNYALLDLGMSPFQQNEIDTLNLLAITLKPLTLSINVLSKDSATLIDAEGVQKFLYEQLQNVNTLYAKELREELMQRMEERRIKILNTLFVYLDTKQFPTNDCVLKYATKTETKEFANELFRRLYPEISCPVGIEYISDSSDLDICSGSNKNTKSMLEEMHETINSIHNPKRSTKRSKESVLNDDFAYLDKSNKRTERLDKLYNAICTISPTSTFSERVFSISGFIKNKQRNRMKAKHLNCILCLKYYFKRQ